jgi:hypothetical protein
MNIFLNVVEERTDLSGFGAYHDDMITFLVSNSSVL